MCEDRQLYILISYVLLCKPLLGAEVASHNGTKCNRLCKLINCAYNFILQGVRKIIALCIPVGLLVKACHPWM